MGAKLLLFCGLLVAHAANSQATPWFDVPQQDDQLDSLQMPNSQDASVMSSTIQAQQQQFLEDADSIKDYQQSAAGSAKATKADSKGSAEALQDSIYKYNLELSKKQQQKQKKQVQKQKLATPHTSTHHTHTAEPAAPNQPSGVAPAAYKFVRATGERAFTFQEATMACRQELDPSAALCSLKEVRAVAKQHSALPGGAPHKNSHHGAKKKTGLVTDWGWTGAPYVANHTSGAFPAWYHIARLSDNGLEDGGPRWSSTASSLYEKSVAPPPERALPTPGWDKPHPMTYSNAHCCSHFKRFAAIGHMGDFTLNQARLKCVSDFTGHLCSVSELEQVFASGVRLPRDRWGWTNTPSTFGNETLNYHTANLWAGPEAAPNTVEAAKELAHAYGGALHDPAAHVHSPSHREWQIGNAGKLSGARRRLLAATSKRHAHKAFSHGTRATNFHEENAHKLHGEAGRVLTGSQNSDTWKGAALCCKGTTYMNRGVENIKKWLQKQQVEDGKFRAGLFQSLDIKKDKGKSLPWPEAAHRSRIYDNAMASIALLIDMDASSQTDQAFQLKAVLRNLYALQGLLEDWSEPLGSKTVAFAFNLEGAPEPHWKSPVYTVDTASAVGQAFAHFALQTGSTAFNRDIQALAKWVVARQRPDGLLIRGFNGEDALTTVTTEDNLEAWFFLRMCSSVLTDSLFNYTKTANELEEAIVKHLWNPKLGSFDMALGSKTMGKEKLKVLKMMARGAVFLLETQRHTFARVMLDHPFWIQHTQQKHSDRLVPGQGWGAVVWAEGAAAIVEAYKRLGDPTAPYMLQDLEALIAPNDDGVQTVAQNVHQFFPYPSVSATAWYLIAQSPRSNGIWKRDYHFSL